LGARVLVLGGEPAERPLVFHGPFVFGSEARVRRAFRDYAEGRMGQLDGVPGR
jgi:redox-sensitive bicupin YhaK (pirin superfamily)